jgi:hypothetical protein
MRIVQADSLDQGVGETVFEETPRGRGRDHRHCHDADEMWTENIANEDEG